MINWIKIPAKSILGIKPGIKPFPEGKIYNFGHVNDVLYRGSYPSDGDLARLECIYNVKTVINLSEDPYSYEKATMFHHGYGMDLVNIPMSDRKYPNKYIVDRLERAVDVVDSCHHGFVYVHCKGGRHRTGVFVAMYRMIVDGWTLDQAYEEMLEYDFYTEYGHGNMKKFIEGWAHGRDK